MYNDVKVACKYPSKKHTQSFFQPQSKTTREIRVFTTMSSSSAAEGLRRMQEDPDIRGEALAATTAVPQGGTRGAARASLPYVPLNAWNGSHRANQDTANLATAAGGIAKFRQMTNAFYNKAFQDSQLDPFIRERSDPHGERFASWIAEKMGLGSPWSDERRTRRTCPFHSKGQTFQTPHDRSSSHFAAWHSPKRSDEKWGRHFKLDDCRVWMRLHFWAAREVGMFDDSPAFMNYYVRFLAHFVSVYERRAPQFARDSARWSADKANTDDYLANNRTMPGIIGLSYSEALAQLPESEREYTGSNASVRIWPYV